MRLSVRGTPSCPKVVFPTIPDMDGAGGEPLIACRHPRSPQGERTSASIPSRPLPSSSEAQRNPLGDRPPSGIGVCDRRPSCPTPDGHPRHQDAEPSQPSPHIRRLHSRTTVLLRDFDQVDKDILRTRADHGGYWPPHCKSPSSVRSCGRCLSPLSPGLSRFVRDAAQSQWNPTNTPDPVTRLGYALRCH